MKLSIEIIAWSELHMVNIMTDYGYIPGKKNILVDQLGCLDQILPMEWSLLLQVFNHLHMDLFATRVIMKLPIYMSHIPNPMAWKEDTLQHLWDSLSAYASPFSLF